MKEKETTDTIKDIINRNIHEFTLVMKVREDQALAFCKVNKDKLEVADLQKAIDNYCYNMAETLIEKYMPILKTRSFRAEVKKYLFSVGADKKHSGKRFHEVFYKQIVDFETKILNENNEEVFKQ